jgi:hypothetical protein
MSDKKIVNSIRGEKVDFDLLRLQINNIPESDTVKHRENLIQGRRKRKNSTKRKVREMFHQQQVNEANMRKALDKQKASAVVKPDNNGFDAVAEIDAVLSLDVSNLVTEDTLNQEAGKLNRKIKGK